ncbi:MAG: DUF3047 domain-containing protein [Deltaproteobacteria bacterium]
MSKVRLQLWSCLLPLFFICAVGGDAAASIIPVSKFRSPDMPGGALEKKIGTPTLKMGKDGETFYLHLQSNGHSSFGVRTSARVNVKDFPIISWRWKVDKMPLGGDVRKKAADDQALQLYVAFKETGFPAVLNTPVIGYIWDNEAPKGWSGRSTQIGGDKMRYIVLRNKTDRTGQWYTERRNVYEDYRRLFGDISGGEPLGVTTGVQVHINTQRTKTPAEGMIGDIYFSSETRDVAVTQAAKEKIVARTPVISAPRRTSIPARTPKLIADDRFAKPGCVNISIPFDFNSTQVEAIAENSIQTIMEYLVKYPDHRLVITGHTDHMGSYAHNMALSRRRAESVRNYLVEKYNIDGQRLIIKKAQDPHSR